MNIRFVSPKLHGAFDYIAGINLIVLPVLLNLGAHKPIGLWLSVAAGIGLIVYSLFTSYTFSLRKAVPFKLHLILDVAAGLAFIAAIFIFNFEGLVAAYYAVMAFGVFALVAVTNPGDDAVLAKSPA